VVNGIGSREQGVGSREKELFPLPMTVRLLANRLKPAVPIFY